MYEINSKLKRLKAYDPVVGDIKIRLDANESFIPLSGGIKQSLCEAVSAVEFNRYPDPFCTRLCRKLAEIQGVCPENIVAGNGSDELLSVIFSAFLEKQDKVMILEPDFSMYRFYADLFELETVVLQKQEPELEVNPQQIIDTAKNSNIKAFVFSNPCNPTSLGLCADTVRGIIKALENCLIILDEAYMDFWDQSLIGEVSQYENVILLRTFSKAFAGAAVRLGYAVCNTRLAERLRAAKSPYNVNSLTQAAGCVLLDNIDEVQEGIALLRKSRERLAQGLTELGFEPLDSKTNFVFVQTPYAEKIYKMLLENGVSVRLMGNALRITAGNEYENRRLLDLLEEFKGKI